MVDLDVLARKARRASEYGRVRAALRVSVPIAALALAAITAQVEARSCLLFAAALLATSVALRWWGRPGALAVQTGMTVGAIPLAAGALTALLGRACDLADPFRTCAPVCLIAGFLAGLGTTWLAGAAHVTHPPRHALLAGMIASLTAAMSCAGFGAGSLLAVLGAMAAGALMAVPLCSAWCGGGRNPP
ncbi:hypothetical protein WME79_15550 [Sorangium sp. So ce726]|uniref:hypothetical protein n=1 Tax=Sorangium sp. So ce726 TaxID=3133319 RepID=UPI003F5DED71